MRWEHFLDKSIERIFTSFDAADKLVRDRHSFVKSEFINHRAVWTSRDAETETKAVVAELLQLGPKDFRLRMGGLSRR